MHFKKTAATIAASFFIASSAYAAGPFDLGVSGGTLGFGPQIGMVIVPSKFDARLNLGYLNYTHNTTSDGVSYEGKLKLENIGLLADFHPFEGAFRITAGIFYNKNQFDLTGQAANGTFTFNGITYTAAKAGTVSAKVSFRKTAPYLGIGWGDGSNTKGLQFTSDLGVIYQGAPTATITATGAASDLALASDVQAAQAKLQSDLNNFKWYPVIQVGMAYRF